MKRTDPDIYSHENKINCFLFKNLNSVPLPKLYEINVVYYNLFNNKMIHNEKRLIIISPFHFLWHPLRIVQCSSFHLQSHITTIKLLALNFSKPYSMTLKKYTNTNTNIEIWKSFFSYLYHFMFYKYHNIFNYLPC
jgi:hypothetical protein